MMNDVELARLDVRLSALERKLDRIEDDIRETRAIFNRGRGAVWVLGVLGVLVGLGLGWAEKIQKLVS
ncbi:MAG: hypothetical protein P1U37_09070 [Minwuia sp.]|nr:hypothetical protein [Minwuia sp.]